MTGKSKPWQANWPAGVPKNIRYLAVPLYALLQKAAENHSSKVAVTFEDKQTTYSDLDRQSNQLANALVKLGIAKGDRVAVFLPNTPEFVTAFFGTLKAGAIVTAINPLHREREVQNQLSDSGAETIVTSDSLYPIVDQIWAKTPLKNVILTNMTALENSRNSRKHGVWNFQRLLQEATDSPLPIHIDPQEDLATLQYTGGTTGTPKAAMLTHSNLVSNAVAFAAWIGGKQAQETFLTALPLFHIYGLTTSMTVPISLAATMVFVPRFEPVKVLDAIERHKVTVFCGVPTMYQALLASPELGRHDLTSIRVCISGASPLPPTVQKRFMEVTGGLLAEGYGLTEASPVTHCNAVDKSMQTVKIGSIGLPLPDTEARIVDLGTGEPLPQGSTGELEVKGPQVMKGYWKRPEETLAVLHDEWLRTGDIAVMDAEGYFFITDRKKDLIKTRGYSVYPRELEDILYENNAVKLCAVIGKPDSRVGEIPKAYVVLKDGATASAEELMAFVNDKLAPYKAIRELEFRKELPLSSAGKVLRRVLLEQQNQLNP